MAVLDNLKTGVFVLVLVGILLGVGLALMDGLAESAQTTTTYVENVTMYTNGNTSLTYSDGVVCTSAQNATKSALTYDTHYTCSSAGVVTAVGTTFNATSIEFTYTYEYDSAATDATQLASGGIDDFASWIATIVVVISAVVIIFLVTGAFGRQV